MSHASFAHTAGAEKNENFDMGIDFDMNSILDWCANYLIILFLGSIGLGFYNILSGVLRGMGVSGVALATICSITMGIRLFNLSPYFISL